MRCSPTTSRRPRHPDGGQLPTIFNPASARWRSQPDPTRTARGCVRRVSGRSGQPLHKPSRRSDGDGSNGADNCPEEPTRQADADGDGWRRLRPLPRSPTRASACPVTIATGSGAGRLPQRHRRDPGTRGVTALRGQGEGVDRNSRGFYIQSGRAINGIYVATGGSSYGVVVGNKVRGGLSGSSTSARSTRPGSSWWLRPRRRGSSPWR